MKKYDSHFQYDEDDPETPWWRRGPSDDIEWQWREHSHSHQILITEEASSNFAGSLLYKRSRITFTDGSI